MKHNLMTSFLFKLKIRRFAALFAAAVLLFSGVSPSSSRAGEMNEAVSSAEGTPASEEKTELDSVKEKESELQLT